MGSAQGDERIRPTEQPATRSSTKKEKGPGSSSEAFDYSGGADRDLPFGLLNAIRNTAPALPEILNRYGYDDDATGD